MNRDRLFQKLAEKSLILLNSLAMVLAVQSANIACAWIFHQPEEPKELKKYRKY